MKVTGAAMVAGVAGYPIAHSLSPVLHNAWIAAAGLDAAYVPFLVDPSCAEAALRNVSRLGIRGVNVTAPLKEAALRAADHASEAASRAGAANLLRVLKTGALGADNTDILGFKTGLETAAPSRDRPALLIGAGGAARAAAQALRGWPQVRVVNRSPGPAAEIAERLGPSARVYPWDRRSEAARGAGLVVNATSLGMRGRPALDLDLSEVDGDCVVYDLVYAPLETPLLAAARARGLRVVDGLHMLIGQARPSFEALFGRPAPEEVDARALLIAHLGERA